MPRMVLLAVTVLGPELPLADHLDHRVKVCFCGRSMRLTRCQECGWIAPWDRGLYFDEDGRNPVDDPDDPVDPLPAICGAEGRWHPPSPR